MHIWRGGCGMGASRATLGLMHLMPPNSSRLLPLRSISCRPTNTLDTDCRALRASNPSSKVERPGSPASMLASTVISRPAAPGWQALRSSGRRRAQTRKPSLARAPAVASAKAGKQPKAAHAVAGTATSVLVQFRLQRRCGRRRSRRQLPLLRCMS